MRLTVTRDGDDVQVGLDLADSALRLTPAQRAAVAARAERVLTAGAGAGKTHTLSLRYVGLLLDLAAAGRDDVEAVLVLTFTEKAAEEMAERCHRRLLALIDAVPAAAESLGDAAAPLARRLTTMADRFEQARIGTFHGFCASLLREFPAATHTPPGIRILDEAEARQLRRAILDEGLRQLVEASPDVLAPLLDCFGTRGQLLEAGALALERRGVLQPILDAHAQGARSTATALAQAALAPEETRRWLEKEGLPALHAIRRLVAPSGGGGRFVAQQLVPLLATFDDPAWVEAPALEQYARYREVLDVLMTPPSGLRTLTHHSVLGTRDQWLTERHYRMAKLALGALQAKLGDWPARHAAAQALPTSADVALYAGFGPFARWVSAAASRLDARLAEIRGLTFDVLQDRAIEAVLGQPELRAALRERHRYVMVDEFQDTDERQWALVRALGRASPDVPEDRLFLVGDVKQAIYGFRGGDVTVFQRATDVLDVDGTAIARLPDNFRSRPELIGWFNDLFPRLLGTRSAHPWDAPYEPLSAGRRDPGGEVLLLEGDRDRLGVGWQPAVVARWLATEWLRPGAPWTDLARHPTPPVAILLRTRTRQGAWEAALRAEGVPFVVAQGIGFWSRPEVLDVVNALSAVVHADPASLAGALRGPWLGLLDQDLQDLHDGRFGGGGLHHFGTAPLDPAAPPRVHRAHARLRAARQEVRRVPVSGVVAGLAAALAPSREVGDPAHAAQAHANVARLVALAAAGNPDGAAAVADRLLGEVEAAERASEAVIVASEARVVLCTVHASKGLEFEGVIVPEADVRPRSRPPPLLVARRDDAWQIAARVLDPAADVQRRVRPGLYSALEAVRTQEEAAEERRLLYVAATRARERLLFVGETPPPPTPGALPTWMQLLLASLPPATRRVDPGRVRKAPVPARGVVHEGPSTPEALPPPAAPRRVEMLASALDRFVQCPARWYRGDLLGVPEAVGAARSTAAVARSAARLAAARGQVLHQLLEDGPEPSSELVARRWRMAATEAGATEAEAERGLSEVTAHLRACREDPRLAEILAAPGHRELPFRVEHEGVVLRGRIDRLWRSAEGWVVLDFKSEALGARTPAEVAQSHAGQLLAYGWAADRALGGVERVVKGQVYLTARGVVEDLAWSEASLQGIPALLEDVARVAGSRWRQVERAATRGDTERPCASCGFFGHGCVGQ